MLHNCMGSDKYAARTDPDGLGRVWEEFDGDEPYPALDQDIRRGFYYNINKEKINKGTLNHSLQRITFFFK